MTDLDPECLVGKVVVDTMNYWPPTDGVQPLFDHPGLGSSERVAVVVGRRDCGQVAESRWLSRLCRFAAPLRAPDRRALGVAGNDPEAVVTIAEVIERICHNAVQLTTLADGRMLQPGGPVFGAGLRRTDFEKEGSS